MAHRMYILCIYHISSCTDFTSHIISGGQTARSRLVVLFSSTQCVNWRLEILTLRCHRGNGKTISIKALMNSAGHLPKLKVEMLYVKSFASYKGPEGAIADIFEKARQMAPCMLIFEDIDSLVTVGVRSYFLNAVDGLQSNDGILMIGSTNHLARLDPGIAKRPSRFDRKYFFSLPDRDERIQYAQYWRNKLKGNEKVDFPEELCGMIADITEKFSFAYMKEAFVASLLTIVQKQNDGDKGKAEDTLLWKTIKIQIKILRDEMEDESVSSEPAEPQDTPQFRRFLPHESEASVGASGVRISPDLWQYNERETSPYHSSHHHAEAPRRLAYPNVAGDERIRRLHERRALRASTSGAGMAPDVHMYTGSRLEYRDF